MPNLDNKEELISTLGGDSVIVSVDSLHKQLIQAFQDVQKVDLPPEYNDVTNVVVCGMGGSRFPALILYYLFKDVLKLPVTVNDDYIIPGSVTEKTLVILSSYSGTTEEVLFCAQDAIKRNSRVISISAGGGLSEMMKESGKPHYVFTPEFNPSGQPRIGFGYSVGAMMGLFVKLGLIDTPASELEATMNALEELTKPFRLDVATDENPAKQLAIKIRGKYPYYIVSEHLTGVGNAFQNQTNETAKSIASYRVIPELNHHMMEGLQFPSGLRDIALFVLFYSDQYSERIGKRFHVTRDVVGQNGIPVEWVELKGDTKIMQVFELMALGSYVSMYLAALYEQDPNAIPFVDYFKAQLSKDPNA